MACHTHANASTAAENVTFETSHTHPLTLSILFKVSELIRPIHSCTFSRLVQTGQSDLFCRLPSTVQIIWVMSRSTHMTQIILTSRTRQIDGQFHQCPLSQVTEHLRPWYTSAHRSLQLPSFQLFSFACRISLGSTDFLDIRESKCPTLKIHAQNTQNYTFPHFTV